MAQIEIERGALVSLDDLEGNCTDIVQGILLNEAKPKVMSKNGISISRITVSSLKIDKVCHGPLKVWSSDLGLIPVR